MLRRGDFLVGVSSDECGTLRKDKRAFRCSGTPNRVGVGNARPCVWIPVSLRAIHCAFVPNQIEPSAPGGPASTRLPGVRENKGEDLTRRTAAN